MECVSDSSVSEVEEIDVPTLVLPYQFEPLLDNCLSETVSYSSSSDFTDFENEDFNLPTNFTW